ncbi:hypothetical protein CORC01_01494 [Colletotrichum orchidophilum]|uniref:Uncharacterized protein n=1 Tax=Colletotrichum orchidophilum TaxID=1209926 RepID=A0A1G4BNS5_9PEZI|nr:uncharacterized protein CORC01_01494 [Colletotrichum orchidophilum]OHF03110.1 hypothetical protein CORC01_01494 [Colletotrichum orchidophilum]
MQFPTFAILATIMIAGAGASPTAKNNPTAKSKTTTYVTDGYSSVCMNGTTDAKGKKGAKGTKTANLFCSGNHNVCPKGKKDTFDDTATKKNEAACKGEVFLQQCTQTIACV